MGIDLYKLDAIHNYKKAIAALENYVDQIIDEFLEAPEGQAYIQAHPDEDEYVGEWFLTVLELAYKTEAITLPHLTPAILEPLLTQTLPPKLSAEEAQDAGSLVPELIAFWSFLKRAYRLPTAPAILQTLKKIHPVFNRKLKLGKPVSSISKSTSPSHYNSNGKSLSSPSKTHHPISDPLRILDSLNLEVNMDDEADISELDDEIDFELDDDIDIDDIEIDLELEVGIDDDLGLDQDFKKVNQHPLAPSPLNSRQAIASTPKNLNSAATKPLKVDRHSESVALTRDHDQAKTQIEQQFSPDDRAETATEKSTKTTQQNTATSNEIPENPTPPPPPSQEAIALLTEQTITATTPGPILHDFQVLLKTLGNSVTSVSAKTKSLPMKVLSNLNAHMVDPIELGLKRPLQKSYPHLHGLCLLLQASGLGHIIKQGSKDVWFLNTEALSLWHTLNPTEQYFALLEAWLMGKKNDLIGGQNLEEQSIANQQDIFELWTSVMPTLKSNNHRELLAHPSGIHTIALMSLFGLLDLQPASPKVGKGWQIQSFIQTPFGLALVPEIQRASNKSGLSSQCPDHDTSMPISNLQATLQPYFPEWQQRLTS